MREVIGTVTVRETSLSQVCVWRSADNTNTWNVSVYNGFREPLMWTGRGKRDAVVAAEAIANCAGGTLDELRDVAARAVEAARSARRAS